MDGWLVTDWIDGWMDWWMDGRCWYKVLYFFLDFFYKDGAALAYVSSKDQKNVEILYKYLVHRIYGLKFNIPASIVERDAIFM